MMYKIIILIKSGLFFCGFHFRIFEKVLVNLLGFLRINSFLLSCENRINNCITELNSTLDTEEVVESVFITKVNFKLLPNSPERVFKEGWFAELTEVNVYCTSSLYFIKFSLHLSEPQTKFD